MLNLKIENNKDIIVSPKKMGTNANKAPPTEVFQTKSILDPKKSADDDSHHKDHFDLLRDHLILQCVVISACSIGYLIFRKDCFNLQLYIPNNVQLYIPDDVLPFGIMLILASIFTLGASYLYARLMSEKFIRITLRNKLALSQTDEFIRAMVSANDDMAETSLTQLDERLRMMVAKNENVLRLSTAETDQKIRRLTSENDQQTRLLAAMTDERIRLLTPENNEYTKLMVPKHIWENKPSTENKNEESDSHQNDSTTVGEERHLSIEKARAISEPMKQVVEESDEESVDDEMENSGVSLKVESLGECSEGG